MRIFSCLSIARNCLECNEKISEDDGMEDRHDTGIFVKLDKENEVEEFFDCSLPSPAISGCPNETLVRSNVSSSQTSHDDDENVESHLQNRRDEEENINEYDPVTRDSSLSSHNSPTERTELNNSVVSRSPLHHQPDLKFWKWLLRIKKRKETNAVNVEISSTLPPSNSQDFSRTNLNENDTELDLETEERIRNKIGLHYDGNYPLKEASSFCYSKFCEEYPSISLDEVVVPGSELQRSMSIQMKTSCSQVLQDECVICMEQFTSENPRIPTVCGCGENMTFFHLPCLLQWTEKRDQCPSCSEKITWDEL